MLDLIIIGGGINGVGIARDAAGRGLKVLLCEKDDLASHTSSSSYNGRTPEYDHTTSAGAIGLAR